MVSRDELLIYGYIREHHQQNDMELPPRDVIVSFMSWIGLSDIFDKNRLHPEMKIHAKSLRKCKRISTNAKNWISAIGRYIVKKGDKRRWKLKIKSGSAVIIGIVDEDIVEQIEVINNFTSNFCRGYGVTIGTWYCLHGKYMSPLGQYQDQFDLSGKYTTISLELDMSRINDQGILRVIIHNKQSKGANKIKTDGTHTNVVFDNIDMDKRYRLAVAFSEHSCNEPVEILSDSEE